MGFGAVGTLDGVQQQGIDRRAELLRPRMGRRERVGWGGSGAGGVVSRVSAGFGDDCGFARTRRVREENLGNAWGICRHGRSPVAARRSLDWKSGGRGTGAR